MSFDAASDSRLLHRPPNCPLDAVNNEPGRRVICDGIGQDTADITLEVNGELFLITIGPCSVKLEGVRVRRFLIKGKGPQGPALTFWRSRLSYGLDEWNGIQAARRDAC
jgi:hypothetical protein